MNDSARYPTLAETLLGCFFTLLCIGGGAGSLVTGFSFPVYGWVLAAGITLLSVVIPLLLNFSRLPHHHRIGWIFPTAAVLGGAVWTVLRHDALLDGLLYAAAIVFRYLCWGFSGLSMPEFLSKHDSSLIYVPYSDVLNEQITAHITEAVLYCALAAALLFGYLYLCNRATIVSALLPLPCFILCFLIIDVTMPALWAVGMLLLYWMLLLFTHTSGKLHPRAAAGQTVFLLLPSLLLFFCIYQFFPREKPVRELLSGTYDRVVDVLAAAEDALSDSSRGDGWFASGLFTVSAEGTEISFDALGDRSYLGRTVMKAKSTVPGIYYLRENTYNFYTGGGWEYLAPDTTEDTASTVHTAPADILRASGAIPATLTLTGARSSVLFTPYYFASSDVPFHADGDRNVVNSDRASDYSVTCYPFSGVFSDLIPTNTAAADTLAVYSDAISDVYTQISDNLAVDLRTLLAANGITADPSNVWDTVAAVTEFVRASAAYSLDAEEAPAASDRDFVLWFLEEAEVGYCTHFATAEVMLLRACGIPARLAAGFLVNITKADTLTPIRDSSAHAWAEIFDARLGWIPVEATPLGGNADAGRGDSLVLGNTVTPMEDTGIVTEELSTEETVYPPDTVDGESTPDTPDTPETLPDRTKPPDTGEEDTAPPSPVDRGNAGGTDGSAGSRRDLSGAAVAVIAVLGTAVLLCILLLFAHRMRRRRLARIRAMYSPDTGGENEAALNLYRRCTQICTMTGDTLPPTLDTLAEKARFSQHTLDGKEFAVFCHAHTKMTAHLQDCDREHPLRRFSHMWIHVFY